jgi:S-methylmethionine-dependent homocysteine/selenocysteine methylase
MYASLINSPQQTKKAIAVYPNSGEVWDGRAKRWLVSGHDIFALFPNKNLELCSPTN